MSKKNRLQIIKELEDKRGETNLICYITSTRNGMEVQMSMDTIRKVYEHLKLIRKSKNDTKIDLFIHSNGGDGTVPWRLITLIREYCDEFSVLVPHRAYRVFHS